MVVMLKGKLKMKSEFNTQVTKISANAIELNGESLTMEQARDLHKSLSKAIHTWYEVFEEENTYTKTLSVHDTKEEATEALKKIVPEANKQYHADEWHEMNGTNELTYNWETSK